jgi:phenylpropionate dioxygenase-like ring-hydroxylating dioxygenase large terminal subunit
MPIPTLNAVNVNRLRQIQQSILDVADRPFEQAIALPATAYTDPDFYNWEVEHIFQHQWLCVGHISQLPNVGDYMNLDLFNEPMTVVRGQDGHISVLSRVCVHRAMDIMPEAYGHASQGNRRSFLCPYHHWSYGLDGQLMGAPHMQQNEAFNAKEMCLHRFRTEIWEGFIFMTFDPSLEPVSSHYAGLLPYVDRWNLVEMEMVANLRWECDFNWKLLVENFMEPYHHMGAHHKTFEPLMPAAGTWTEPETPNYVVCHLPLTKTLVEKVKAGEAIETFLAPQTLKPEDHHEYAVYLGEPNFLLFIGPDQAYWYFLIPQGADKMVLHTTLLVTPESKQMEDYEQKLEQTVAALRRFHMEDMEVCSAMQSGLNSAFYAPGPLSHLEMPIWLFQRYLARQIRANEPSFLKHGC